MPWSSRTIDIRHKTGMASPPSSADTLCPSVEATAHYHSTTYQIIGLAVRGPTVPITMSILLQKCPSEGEPRCRFDEKLNKFFLVFRTLKEKCLSYLLSTSHLLKCRRSCGSFRSLNKLCPSWNTSCRIPLPMLALPILANMPCSTEPTEKWTCDWYFGISWS